MKQFLFIILSLILFESCHRVPVTGRHQFNLIPDGQMVALGEGQYKEFIQKHSVESGTSNSALLQKVGKKLSLAVEKFMKENEMDKELSLYKWEYNLVRSSEVNAWCLPGGKIVVYTGILSITQDEAGLATVLGHEIAHAIAKHGSERMSQMLAVQLGGIALDIALTQQPNETKKLYEDAYGMGSSLGYLLPFSRKHETEADKLGLVFMAMAGYNPQEALVFWNRMSKTEGSSVPEFVSTHPSDKKRMLEINKFLPTAFKYYKPS